MGNGTSGLRLLLVRARRLEIASKLGPLPWAFGGNIFLSDRSQRNAQQLHLWFPGVSQWLGAVVKQLYNPDKNNFGPRLGFAYSPNLLNKRATVAVALESSTTVRSVGVQQRSAEHALFSRCQHLLLFRSGQNRRPASGIHILYTVGSNSRRTVSNRIPTCNLAWLATARSAEMRVQHDYESRHFWRH